MNSQRMEYRLLKTLHCFGGIAALAILTAPLSHANEYDLSASGNQSLNVVGAFGGAAIVADFWSQPTGTGVFDPFLTLDANGHTSTGSKSIESAYNSDGSAALYLDALRPNWNHTLHIIDLAPITINDATYF